MFEHFSEKDRAILAERARQIANDKLSGQEQNIDSLLRCRVGREWYGLPLPDMTAIYRNTRVIPVPGTPAFFKGIANIRGRILPVLELRELLSSKGDNASHNNDLVVVTYEDQQVALRVDQVDNVVAYHDKDLQPVPEEIRTKHVHNCLVDGTLILDIGSLLSDPDLIIDI